MAVVEKFGKHPESGRAMFLLELDSLEDWPEDLRLGKSRHFVLFLAVDAGETGDDEVAAFAHKALSQGMVYLSAWGKDAERVHDVFEEAGADWDPDSDADSAVLSEWHEGEPLSGALKFAVALASPSSDYERSCKATLAVSIGNPDWAESIRQWLEDPRKLDDAAEEGEDSADAEEEEEEAAVAEDEEFDLDDDEEEGESDEEDDDDAGDDYGGDDD